MNTLFPGLVGTFFIFFFGTFACLILACAQISHGANFNLHVFCCWLQQMLTSPVIRWNFHMEIFFPGSITEWAWSIAL